ncbi:helix-turn-helix domain-containing protein [Rhodococcus hoagii]|nr:helix-turn-helix domain-containing protein [Prescottella equi]
MALLLREAIGDSLRRTRVSQSRTLREVSNSARVSLGYLSEIERGRKEASSELLAAICDALEVRCPRCWSTSASRWRSSLRKPRAVTGAAQQVTQQVGGRIAQDTRVVIPAPTARALAAA